ncbi:hypothetical protein ABW55_09755 [Acinetobacter sp. C15]|nr:hypothetical protein ABW55_09755 [Acinetobacter sp. C15]
MWIILVLFIPLFNEYKTQYACGQNRFLTRANKSKKYKNSSPKTFKTIGKTILSKSDLKTFSNLPYKLALNRIFKHFCY